jgi:hypothetical protein
MSVSALTDWLGSGGRPIPAALAQHRADVCLICVENKEPLWWERVIKHPVAVTIRKTLAIKASMDLKVNGEIELGICRVCGCCIPLKVHTPIEHILAHESHAKPYPDNCWIHNERPAK